MIVGNEKLLSLARKTSSHFQDSSERVKTIAPLDLPNAE
jgi:hypothetical protein